MSRGTWNLITGVEENLVEDQKKDIRYQGFWFVYKKSGKTQRRGEYDHYYCDFNYKRGKSFRHGAHGAYKCPVNIRYYHAQDAYYIKGDSKGNFCEHNHSNPRIKKAYSKKGQVKEMRKRVIRVNRADIDNFHSLTFFFPRNRISGVASVTLLARNTDQREPNPQNGAVLREVSGNWGQGNNHTVRFKFSELHEGNISVFVNINPRDGPQRLIDTFNYFVERRITPPPTPPQPINNVPQSQMNRCFRIKDMSMMKKDEGKRNRPRKRRRLVLRERKPPENSDQKSQILAVHPNSGSVSGNTYVHCFLYITERDFMERLRSRQNMYTNVTFGDTPQSSIYLRAISDENDPKIAQFVGDPEMFALLRFSNVVIECTTPPRDRPELVDVSVSFLRGMTFTLRKGYQYVLDEKDREKVTGVGSLLLKGNSSGIFSVGNDFLDECGGDDDNNDNNNDFLDINFDDLNDEFGASTLFYAVAQNRFDVVKKLVGGRKEMVEEMDVFGYTPLDVGRYFGRTEIVEYMEKQIIIQEEDEETEEEEMAKLMNTPVGEVLECHSCDEKIYVDLEKDWIVHDCKLTSKPSPLKKGKKISTGLKFYHRKKTGDNKGRHRTDWSILKSRGTYCGKCECEINPEERKLILDGKKVMVIEE